MTNARISSFTVGVRWSVLLLAQTPRERRLACLWRRPGWHSLFRLAPDQPLQCREAAGRVDVRHERRDRRRADAADHGEWRAFRFDAPAQGGRSRCRERQAAMAIRFRSGGARRESLGCVLDLGRGSQNLRGREELHLCASTRARASRITSFGKDGRIDLRENLGRAPEKQSVVETSPGIIYKDLLIVGGRLPESLPAPPGDIRAYDVRTGALRWTFHTIPHPGEPGLRNVAEGCLDLHGRGEQLGGHGARREAGHCVCADRIGGERFLRRGPRGRRSLCQLPDRAERRRPASGSGIFKR